MAGGARRPQVLATICARGGSKGVPGKNIRLLLGRPLLGIAIECARAAASVDRIVVSTDSDDVASIAEQYGIAVPFRRPAELATDAAPKAATIEHAAAYVEAHEHFTPDLVVDLDVGVPLRAPADVDACVERLARQADLDGVVTVYEAERNPYFNMVEIDRDGRLTLVKRPAAAISRRQDAPAVYSVSPSVFAFRRDRLATGTHLHTGRWAGCVVPRERAIDIDTELEFQFVEFLMTRVRVGVA